MTRRPKINLHPFAQRYAADDEQIIEYSSTGGGGLIAFRITGEDEHGVPQLRVDLYRHDASVAIVVGPGDGPVFVQPEPAVRTRACHDCARPVGSASPGAPMGVLVFRGDGHGGTEAVPDRDQPDKQAVRCMDCEDRAQHPEPTPVRRPGTRRAR